MEENSKNDDEKMLVPLNSYEIKVLVFLSRHVTGSGITVDEIRHHTNLGVFKVRRTLESLENKRLVRSLERSKTKPYILSGQGKAVAWLTGLSGNEINELYMSVSLKSTMNKAEDQTHLQRNFK